MLHSIEFSIQLQNMDKYDEIISKMIEKYADSELWNDIYKLVYVINRLKSAIITEKDDVETYYNRYTKGVS